MPIIRSSRLYLCYYRIWCVEGRCSSSFPHPWHIACCPAPDRRPPATKALHTVRGNNTSTAKWIEMKHNMYVYFTCICTLSTLFVEHIISSIRINRMTTRSRWKFRICTINNDLTLYSFSSLYIFVTWGWPTVAEICRQPNETYTKTVAFRRIYLLLILQPLLW